MGFAGLATPELRSTGRPTHPAIHAPRTSNWLAPVRPAPARILLRGSARFPPTMRWINGHGMMQTHGHCRRSGGSGPESLPGEAGSDTCAGRARRIRRCRFGVACAIAGPTFATSLPGPRMRYSEDADGRASDPALRHTSFVYRLILSHRQARQDEPQISQMTQIAERPLRNLCHL